MAPSFDTAGWFANDAGLFRDIGSVLLDTATAPGTPKRMLILTDAFERTDPMVADAINAMLGAASGVLPDPEPVQIAGDDTLEIWWDAFRVLQASEVAQVNNPWVAEHQPNLGPGIRERFAMAAAITPDEIQAANGIRRHVRQCVLSLATPDTILCLPTAPVIAPKTDASPDDLEFFRANTMALTCIAGHTWPAAESRSPPPRWRGVRPDCPSSAGREGTKPCSTSPLPCNLSAFDRQEARHAGPDPSRRYRRGCRMQDAVSRTLSTET